MNKMVNDSAHALKEFHRIERVLSETSAVSLSARRWLDNRRNILASFTFASNENVSGILARFDESVTVDDLSNTSDVDDTTLYKNDNSNLNISSTDNINVKDEL